jgi:hypothetical protein
MPDRDRDLVGLFVRDLDGIELPARDQWRPAPRKESAFIMARRYVLTASAIAAGLVLALVASFVLRDNNPVAAPQSASPTSSATATATSQPSATSSPAGTTTSQPTGTTGVITGQLGYPSEFVPPLTVYAISVNDPNVWYSTNTPYFGNFTRPTASPAPSFAATWPPAGEGRYQLSVPAGTYYVIAYSNDTGLPKDLPAAYTRFTVDCILATTGGQNSTPAPACGANPQDHTLVPVTVRAGETTSRIDVKDWGFQNTTFPPRPTPR